jgi:hypothetical protein
MNQIKLLCSVFSALQGGTAVTRNFGEARAMFENNTVQYIVHFFCSHLLQ